MINQQRGMQHAAQMKPACSKLIVASAVVAATAVVVVNAVVVA